ncbi:MAG: hypothetical protein EAZ15_00350 [Sphingobacteriales bacterium]|nr:MAG: hypothetical protein EAZ15_00350 [Sphingobacteriales bacterium]
MQHHNKNPKHKELITHIVAKLATNEEPYAVGAWENFNKKKKRKSIIRLRSAAAILLLGCGLFFWFNQSPKNTIVNYANVKQIENKTIIAKKSHQKTDDLKPTRQKYGVKINTEKLVNVAFISSKNAIKQDKSYQKSVKNTLNLSNQNQLLMAKTTGSTAISNLNKPLIISAIINLPLLNQNINFKKGVKQRVVKLNSAKTEGKINTIIYDEPSFNNDGIILVDTTNLLTANKANLKQSNQNNFIDTVAKQNVNIDDLAKIKKSAFLEKESKVKEVAKTSKKSSKWLLGLAIAPSFGNTSKLNMGYGLNMDYALNSKISINSGLGYNQLSTTQNINGANVFAESSSIKSTNFSVKNLESVNANVSGIDIPIEIKYNINKSIYANVGVSAFAVLNQQRSNNYIEEKLVNQISTSVSGEEQPNNFLVYERSTEQVADNQIKNPNFLAFYNFSFGFRQKIAKKTFVAFEPFVKLPVREISAEKLRLVGTGLRLRFNF